MRSSTRPVSTGVCSVSFRALTTDAIIALARDSDLDGIEWGADIHVPVGEIERAAAVADATEAAGLRVLSYGSYWSTEDDDFADILRTAVELRAPRIRVWAGKSGSPDASEEYRSQVVRRVNDAADLAAAQGVELGLEFHGGTLTDTVPSTERLLGEIDHPNVRTYWQPAIDVEDADALAGLDRLMHAVSTVHVFSWWPGTERRPLAYRSEFWTAVVERVLASGTDHDLVLEFVPEDDPARLAGEASTLRAVIEAAHTRRGAL